MKLHYGVINVILALICISNPAIVHAQSKSVRCVVVDAGHGGKDPGATNGKLREKDITLTVALKFGELLQAKFPEIQVVYTRKTDIFVPLQTRSAIANKADADLFISIHTNAAKNTAASGTETFLMGVDKNGANLSVAMRENDVIAYEADYSTIYQGYEPGSSESFIIFSLMNYAFQSQSIRMATLVQKEFAANLPMKNRGVKQAGYLVLWNTSMPSILTEIGFISNSEESRYIASTAGQTKIAEQLLAATEKYIAHSKHKDIQIEKIGTKEIKVADVTLPADKTTSGTSQKKTPQKTETKPVAKQNIDKELFYRVLATESDRRLVVNSRLFGPYVSVVEEKKEGEKYKYYIKSVISYKEALLLQDKVKELFPKATIIAFPGDK